MGRGSAIPRIVAMSIENTLLPLQSGLEGKVTDPTYGSTAPTNQTTLMPEYVVDPNVVWTIPSNDPRRTMYPDPTEMNGHSDFVNLLNYSWWGNTYGWLPDTNEMQEIFQLSRKEKFYAKASRMGGIGRPENEIIPMVPVGRPQPTPGNNRGLARS